MPLAGRVLDEDDFAGADHPRLAVARGYLHPGIEIDDVLPARRRVPVEIVIGLHLAENDAGGGQSFRQFPGAALLDPLDLDVAEMRLALGIGVQVVDPHRRLLGGWRRDCSGGAVTGASAIGRLSRESVAQRGGGAVGGGDGGSTVPGAMEAGCV